VKNGIPGLSFAEVLWPHSQHRRRGDGDPGGATWCNGARMGEIHGECIVLICPDIYIYGYGSKLGTPIIGWLILN